MWCGAQIQGFLSGLQRLLPQLQALADILPAPTLDWKLDILEAGCRCCSCTLPCCWLPGLPPLCHEG